MKKSIYILAFAALFFTACNGGNTQSSSKSGEMKETKMKSDAVYACPMKCEGEKTYAEKGSCPKCGMDLKDVNSDMKHDEHDGHNH